MSDAAVAAIVFDADKKKYLLVKRRDVPIWVLPGGGVDPGETPEVAAVREVQEESGLQVEVVRKVAEYSPVGRFTCETHLFECAVVSGSLGLSDETLGADFYPVDHYPPPAFDIHRNWLFDALENNPDVIRKPVQGLSWLSILRMIATHPVLSARFLLSKTGLRWNSNA